MKDPTVLITESVRIFMARFARFLNKVTKGKVLPAHITVLSFLGHIPAGWALYNCRPLLAASLITVFGLMDSLDGALAREQNNVSRLGMFFDAVTDRLKEIIIYATLAVFVARHQTNVGPWVVAAVAGTSILVSYVKAKGEMALSGTTTDVQKLNKAFDGGIARYEIRMALLIVGLLIESLLGPLLRLIVALNLFTAAFRFLQISQLLYAHENVKKPKETSKKQTK